MIVNRTLATPVPLLDLSDGIGQRSITFRFDLIDGATGQNLGEITPLRTASLNHSTTSTIKRQLRLDLGAEDTAEINPLTNQIDPYMILSDGTEYGFGRFVFTDPSFEEFTSGNLASLTLMDQMFIVDQPITTSLNVATLSANAAIFKALAEFTFHIEADASPFNLDQGWGLGAGRGQVLDSICVTGDYFSPWFGNDGAIHFIRSFNPADAVPTFDFDSGNQVLRAGITSTNDALTAPNRFMVIGSSNSGVGADAAVVGIADIPDSAPHSFVNRGFYIIDSRSLSVSDGVQAGAVARNLALRQEVAEQVTLQTALDPRHDSYDVVLWQGEKWLETAWTMDMTDGGTMSHTLRKAY